MSDDNVVQRFPGLPVNPLAIDLQRTRYCSHDAVRLNEHDRTVICVACGATLDAFNYLRDNARTIEMAWHHYRAVMKQVAEVGERVHELKKEKARLQQTIKRLTPKAGDMILTRNRKEP